MFSIRKIKPLTKRKRTIFVTYFIVSVSFYDHKIAVGEISGEETVYIVWNYAGGIITINRFIKYILIYNASIFLNSNAAALGASDMAF